MKKVICGLLLMGSVISVSAQDFSSIFTSGLEVSNQFAEGYLEPGAEAMVYSMNNGWFSSAEAKPILGFEISIIGNVAAVQDDKRTFNFAPDPQYGLTYMDGSSLKDVATILGTVDPDIVMEYTVTDPITGLSETVELVLPESITEDDINNIPSGYLQASLGILKGTELKFRVFPNTDINDRKIGMYGGAIQHEFTSWLPAESLFPVAISGLVAYSKMDASYSMENVSNVDGDNQRFENTTKTWLFQSIFSTKLPVINFYGGVGYLVGNSQSDLKGSYIVYQGFGVTAVVDDPISVTNKVSGVRATLGTRLKLGFFRLNADYTFAAFNTASVGVSFGFR